MTTLPEKKFTKKERSWILYDWANSVYATNIMAAIFPIIFVAIAGDKGDIWWGYGTSFSTLIVALLAPFLGSIADFKGMKKKLFTTFVLLGIIATAFIALTNDWRFMLVGYVLSKIGFSGSNLFYDSFLTDVTTNERMDKVSSWGYAMGYIGGSTIPFIISIAVLLILGYDNVFAQKFSIIITSVWWLVFSIPFLRNVEQEHYIERPQRISFRHAFQNVLKTARDITKSKGMLMFIIAYFFYIDGVGTVISISTAYGTALGLGATGMILALLVTQIVAMPSSILFAKLAKKISTRKALLIAIGVYMFICLVGFYMGFSLEPHQKAFDDAYKLEQQQINDGLTAYAFEDGETATEKINELIKTAQSGLHKAEVPIDLSKLNVEGFSPADQALITQAAGDINPRLLAFRDQQQPLIQAHQDAIQFSTYLFWGMAILVGTMQGGIQAASRSYFGKLVPKKRSNEYFGFFDIFGKFAAVIGPALYSFTGNLTGRSSYGTLILVALFLIGFVTLIVARKPLEELEQERARQTALEAQ